MLRLIHICVVAVAFYFAPEVVPWQKIIAYGAQVLTHVTLDSILAWVIVLSRRFVLKTLPYYAMTWFLRPLAPRVVRRRVDAFYRSVGEIMHAAFLILDRRTKIFRTTPMRILLSLTFSVCVFAVVHHYFGHYVIVVLGFWPFIKVYVLYAFDSLQNYLFRVAAFLGLDGVVIRIKKWLPDHLYRAVYRRVHGTYRLMLRYQIKSRFRMARTCTPAFVWLRTFISVP